MEVREEMTLHTWKEVVHVYRERSSGREDSVEREMTFNLNLPEASNRPDGRFYGSFEWYDAGCEYYSEGGLWFDASQTLVDYDGCFSLCSQLKDKIVELGWNLPASC